MESWQAEIAAMAVKHDTVMAQAFCRALGIEPPKRRRRRRPHHRVDRYAGMDECRKQRYGVRL